METSQISLDYPRVAKGRGGQSIALHRLGPKEIDRVTAFASSLEPEDLLFLRADLTNRKVIEEFCEEQQGDQRVTLLAEENGEVIGYGSLVRRPTDWMRHIAEIRVITSRQARGQGLGRMMVKELSNVAEKLGVTKLVAQMVREQEGARSMFEKLGFSAEALLPDWVIDRDGRTRDLVLMTRDVTSLTN